MDAAEQYVSTQESLGLFPGLIAPTAARPVRILHQLGGLNRGGIETWLMHVLRRTDRSHFQMDFFVRGSERGEYEDEVEAFGSQVGRTLRHRHPFKYHADLRAFIEEHGPYDILHSHLSDFNGPTMLAAFRLGIKVRISHSHNDTRCIDEAAPLHRRTYSILGRRLIRKYSTHRLAVSTPAALSQFGEPGDAGPDVQILHCGIDLAPFVRTRSSGSRDLLRRQLGIPEGAFVVGHVGRFVAQKNHEFLIKIADVLAQNDPAVHFLMVGSGPLLEDVKSLVSRSGLGSRVVFLRSRPDIPRLMLEAMDLFLFPSHYEGLGIVLLEAQASGLPCIVSDVIPEEACVTPGSIEFVSLRRSAEEWAARVQRYNATLRSTPQVSSLSGTSFDITVSAGRLFELYSRSVFA